MIFYSLHAKQGCRAIVLWAIEMTNVRMFEAKMNAIEQGWWSDTRITEADAFNPKFG